MYALGRPVMRFVLHTLAEADALPDLEGASAAARGGVARAPAAAAARRGARGEPRRARTIWSAWVDGEPVAFAYAPWRSPTWFDTSVDTLRERAPARAGHARRRRAHPRRARAGPREPVWGADIENVASRRLAKRLGVRADRRDLGGAAVKALLVIALAAATARAEPSDRDLVLAGLAMAPPTWASSACRCTRACTRSPPSSTAGRSPELHLFPPGIDPHTQTFRFGWTYVTGLQSKADKIFFYIGRRSSSMWRADRRVRRARVHRYLAEEPLRGAGAHRARHGLLGRLPAKDVVLVSPTNDVVKIFNLWCMTGWKQAAGAPRLRGARRRARTRRREAATSGRSSAG